MLTHFNSEGNAHMVDVGEKTPTTRTAVAEGFISLNSLALNQVIQGSHKKGDVIGIARIAGIMATKRTAEVIPLCHPVPVHHVNLEFESDPKGGEIRCLATVKSHGITGVEMEALHAVQTALLTIYDMCKSVDRCMIINKIRLLEKHGGKSGSWTSADPSESS
jgi:cyclic pyranopterin monophosphate synthase